MCLEGIGKSRKGHKDLGIMTFKGCASEAMCHSSLLALVQEIDDAEILCCQGNLCNTRIVNGVVTEFRVSDESPDLSEDEECSATAASTPGNAASPACGYKNEEDEAVPSPGSHASNKTSTVDHNDILADNTTGHENNTTAGNPVTTSLHPGEVAVDEQEFYDDLFTGYYEVETASPIGDSASEHHATGGSPSTTNLDRNNLPGAGNTSSSNHGNVVVLVPIIVPKRNVTATTTLSSSSFSFEATNTNDVVGAAHDDDVECEEEEKDISPREHFTAYKEHQGASTQSPRSTVVLGGDHSSTGVFTTERHGSTHSPATGTAESTNVGHSHFVHSQGTTSKHSPRPGLSGASSPGATNVVATGGENFVAGGSTPPANTVLPIPYITTKENDTFATGSANPSMTDASVPAANNNPDREALVSGSEVGTSRPKNKIPCKRPGTPKQPGVNLMSSPEAEKQVMGDSTSWNEADHPQRSVPGKTHFPDKTNPYSGAFRLATNLGLFSLTLFLAALLH
ncbi:uncharacterized protein LOC143838975 [Paroedura picta]|uniref:uncharacterized protein LOC143838975 n=1 Tax=Paroedura picta TaxID=143630 RepID=UPI004055D2B8